MIHLSKIEHRSETRIQVKFERNGDLISKIKSIEGRRWSQTKRCWHLPYSKDSFENLKKVFGEKQLVFLEKEKSKNIAHNQKVEISALGIPPDNFQVVVQAEHEFQLKVIVPWQKKEWITKIKSLPERAWNTKEKYWSVPKNIETLNRLKQLFENHLVVDKALESSMDVSKNKKSKKKYNTNANIFTTGSIDQLELAKKEYRKIQRDGKTINAFVGNKVLVEKGESGWLKVYVPFDKKGWIEVVRNIPGRQWKVEEKYWEVPYVKDSIKLLHHYLENQFLHFNFEIQENIPKQYKGGNKPRNRKHYDKGFNEMQKRAITALEEKLILEGKRYRTIKTYKNHLKAFLRFYKNKKPSQISYEEITKYIIVRKKHDNISDSYLNQFINTANAFYVRVLNQKDKLAKLERPPKRKSLPNVFSVEEIEQLLKQCQNLKHKCMLILTYSAGLRKGEILNLRVDDLSFNRKTIFVKNGKGGKDRYTFLSETAIKFIKPYLKQYHPSLWLFEGQTGGKYSESSIQEVFKNASRKAKVNQLVTLHGLRHSFATHLVEKGVPLHVIQELLGHSSIKTTEIYLHISTKYRKELRSPLDDMDI